MAKREKQRLTNSERKTASCPTEWLIRYGLELKPRRVASRAIEFGSLFHEAIEAYFKNNRSVPKGIDAALKFLRDSPFEGDAPEGQDLALTVADTLIRYDKFWGGNLDGLRFEVVANELTIEAKLPGTRVLLAGKVDCIVRDSAKRLWILDHKTSATDGRDWKRKNQGTLQLIHYVLLVEAHFGEPVHGVVFDVVNSKQFRNAAQIGRNKDSAISKVNGLPSTDAASFAAAMAVDKTPQAEWYQETLRALAEADEDGRWFCRAESLVSRDEIERAKAELIVKARELQRWKTKVKKVAATIAAAPSGWSVIEQKVGTFTEIMHEFPRNPNACIRFNRRCDYFDFCSRPCVDTAHGSGLEFAPAHGELGDENQNENGTGE